jgi:hygromycin-B 7''-O-kinase
MSATPAADDEAGWDTLLADESALAPRIDALLARHGLAQAPRQRYDSGSLPVYALGEHHVLKLFPPHEREHAAVEARVLAALDGALPLPTPQLFAAADDADGWPYLLMGQLQGQRLVNAWPALNAAERDDIADALGTAIAALHAIDTTPLADLPPDWDHFFAAQAASAVERQAARGLPAHWLDQLGPFLARWSPPPTPRRVLLHTEIMREHLFVERTPRGARLSGLIDFEPAMLGASEYEFASVGLFVACGDARVLRRVLRAYGYAAHTLDEALQCRLMAQALLHRYSNLPWYLKRLPPGDATTIEQLAARWWPLS